MFDGNGLPTYEEKNVNNHTAAGMDERLTSHAKFSTPLEPLGVSEGPGPSSAASMPTIRL